VTFPSRDKKAIVPSERETPDSGASAIDAARSQEKFEPLASPILLRDKPTPPEVAVEMEHQARGCRLSRRDRSQIEEDFKLRFYFGGHSVIATPSRHGLLIHAIDLDDPDEYHALRVRLRSEGHPTVLSFYPRPWGEIAPEIISLFAVD
jgi:hypothetical protein